MHCEELKEKGDNRENIRHKISSIFRWLHRRIQTQRTYKTGDDSTKEDKKFLKSVSMRGMDKFTIKVLMKQTQFVFNK